MAGEELLIADSTERDREGLRQLFDQQGYVCTAVGDVATARDLVARKFFPAAVVDLDFGTTGGGIDLARHIRAVSQPTRIVILAGRRSFEDAVDALRLGVVDVVSKRPDQIAYLQSAVGRAFDLYRTGDGDSALMGSVRDVLEESLRIMMGMSRKLHGGGSTSLSMKPAILIIDEDQGFLQQAADLLKDKPWDVSVELSGGSGLDKASTFSFQIVAVRGNLMDLPGHMVLKSAQAQQTETLGLVYTPGAGGQPGKVERYESGSPTRAWPFMGPHDLIKALEELTGELSARSEERRMMQAFRGEHGAFLKRFAELKVRLDGLG